MKIVVLAGGLSMERDVSITSGTMVCSALRKRGHQAILLDVYLGKPEMDLEQDVFQVYGTGEMEAPKISRGLPNLEKIRNMRTDSQVFFGPNVITLCQMADIVFLALHGENGENGKLQAAFDLLGIKYTGTGSLGSALAMHKGISKEIFQQRGIPTPVGFFLKRGEPVPADCPFPCVVKPCSGGSSVGVSIIFEKENLEAALQQAFAYEDELVIEQYIKGREFSIGVLNGKALPIIEIIPKAGFYDYENKYQSGYTTEECPARLDEATTRQMQDYAEKVYQALKLEVYGRMDFLLEDRENPGEEPLSMYCLEANTLPGMTPLSLIPQEAAQIGLDYGELCEKIIKSSLEKI